MKRILSLCILLSALASFWAYAQITPDPVSLAANPSSPDPGSEVKITVSTPTFDKNTTEFVWTVDGKSRPDLSGAGKSSFVLRAPDLGSPIKVSIEALSMDGGGGRASLVVYPSILTLTWFTENYIPRWYKGKALAVVDSEVTVVAVPQISIGRSRIEPEELIYQWSLDDTDNMFGGPGQRKFSFKTSSNGMTHHVRITVRDPQGQVVKTGQIFIDSRDPKIALYRVSPLGGVEHRRAPFDIASAPESIVDIAIEPFYFSIRSRDELLFGWSVNGSTVQGDATEPAFLTVHMPQNQKFETPVTVSVTTKDPFFVPLFKTLLLRTP